MRLMLELKSPKQLQILGSGGLSLSLLPRFLLAQVDLHLNLTNPFICSSLRELSIYELRPRWAKSPYSGSSRAGAA